MIDLLNIWKALYFLVIQQTIFIKNNLPETWKIGVSFNSKITESWNKQKPKPLANEAVYRVLNNKMLEEFYFVIHIDGNKEIYFIYFTRYILQIR